MRGIFLYDRLFGADRLDRSFFSDKAKIDDKTHCDLQDRRTGRCKSDQEQGTVSDMLHQKCDRDPNKKSVDHAMDHHKSGLAQTVVETDKAQKKSRRYAIV